MKLKGADAEHEQHEALVQHYQVRINGNLPPLLSFKEQKCFLAEIFAESLHKFGTQK